MLLDDCHIEYINLSHRADRRVHMEAELAKAGLVARRFDAWRPSELALDEYKVAMMRRRTPGAIGCWLSQVGVMVKAQIIGKHAFVMEDDLIICSDFKERMAEMEEFLCGKDWDIIWLGGTVHINPPYWYTGGNPDLPGSVNLQKDALCTDHPRIIQTYGAFSTHAYIVNKHKIERILNLLNAAMPRHYGIDHAFIRLEPQLKCYMYLPGCIRQMDNQSDIGNGITYFSNFAKLGPYWYQDKKENFDPSTFNFAECKR